MDTIAFFCDRTMLPGLHVTIYTLLTHLEHHSCVRLIVFADNLTSREKKQLIETHDLFRKNTEIQIVSFTPEAPAVGANALKGNYTTYGRLSLARLLPDCDRCIYLDSDLYVAKNIAALFSEIPPSKVLIVDGVLRRESSHDQEVFQAANLDMQGRCFNPGVMGMNLKRWRDLNVDEICESVVRKYPNCFKSADQTLLNIALHNEFERFDHTYNYVLCPEENPLVNPTGFVVHFVRSPKPWDFLGSFIHRNYELWKNAYVKSSIGSENPFHYLSFYRSVRILPAYARVIWNRVSGASVGIP